MFSAVGIAFLQVGEDVNHAEQEPTPVAAIAGQINRAGAASREQLELFEEAA